MPALVRTVRGAGRARWPGIVVVAGYLGLALLVTGRFLGDPAGTVSAHLPPDHTWFQWLLSHGAHSVRTLTNPLFSTQQNVPYGVNMMANTSVLGVTLPLAPLTWWLGARVTYLIWMIAALAGTALTTYLVLHRHVVSSRAAAFAGGAFAGFAPGVVHHANGQPNFVSNFLLPLIVARALTLGRDGRLRRDGVALGLLVAWQLFINEELLLITALACAVAAAVRPRKIRRMLPGLAVTALVSGMLCAYPIWFQFFGPQSYRGVPMFTGWGEDPVTWLTFARDTIAGDASAETAQGRTEQNSWFGWPLTLLVLVLCVTLRRRMRAAVAVVAVFGALSLGPRLRFGGALTDLPGPLAVVPDWLPLFDLAMPSRLTFAVIGAIAVLVAVAFDRGGRAWRVAVVAVLLPLTPTPVPAMPEPPTPAFITSGAWREFVPAGRTLVPVPLPSQYTGRDSLGWSAWAQHRFAVPEGYFLGPGPDGAGQMGTTHVSHTTTLVERTLRAGAAPVLTAGDAELVRADARRWNGSVVVMRSGPGYRPLHDLISQVYGVPSQAGGVWLWDLRER
ncbi:glycosyl transferase [Actinoplanes couchii]|uniref:Glycosyl transferase n=1 Tax=Actinoplanes couchii TaxID=403638 RepID=A0ABQ3XU80_9ACTN|nr:glycosyl transferase [Actinoplanes couchii]